VRRRRQQQGVALEGIEHLDQAVRAVAQAEPAAQGKLSVEAGREQRQRQVGEAVFVDQSCACCRLLLGCRPNSRRTCSLVTRP
jgi:hypothetical protein